MIQIVFRTASFNIQRCNTKQVLISLYSDRQEHVVSHYIGFLVCHLTWQPLIYVTEIVLKMTWKLIKNDHPRSILPKLQFEFSSSCFNLIQMSNLTLHVPALHSYGNHPGHARLESQIQKLIFLPQLTIVLTKDQRKLEFSHNKWTVHYIKCIRMCYSLVKSSVHRNFMPIGENIHENKLLIQVLVCFITTTPHEDKNP